MDTTLVLENLPKNFNYKFLSKLLRIFGVGSNIHCIHDQAGVLIPIAAVTFKKQHRPLADVTKIGRYLEDAGFLGIHASWIGLPQPMSCSSNDRQNSYHVLRKLKNLENEYKRLLLEEEYASKLIESYSNYTRRKRGR